MADSKVVKVVLQLEQSQYIAMLQAAGQEHQLFSGKVASTSQTASAAVKNVATALDGVAASNKSAAGDQFIESLREQIAVSGKSTDELLRYQAARAGVAAQASPLILQLQNQRAAQQAAAEAARAEEAAQREAAAAKQRAAGQQAAFLAGLREEVELQGKSHTEILRYRAAQMGVSGGAEQYIQAIESANKAHGRGAISAAQHAAAMRMLPAQMTDIVTSMASGMPIWMVAIQQGGQIKDSFGGAGAALRAMTGAITPAVAGVGLLAGTVGVAALAYYKGSAEADVYREAIVMSGNAAGTTVGRLTDMARAIAQVTGTQGAAAAALAQMAGSGDIAAENLQHFAAVAMDLDRYVGVPVKNVVADLEKLAEAPLAASVKLNQQYHYLTEAVYSHIKALDEQGKKEEAGAAAQRAYISAFEARKNEIVANLGSIERGWNAVTNAAKKGWDSILNIGREDTSQQRLDAISARIAQLRKAQEGNGFAETGGGAATGRGGAGAQARQKELDSLLAAQAALQENVRLEQRGAEAKAESARKTEALAEWDQVVTANLSKQAKEAKEIEVIRRKGNAAGKDAAEIEKEIAAYKAKNADKGAANSATRELERQRALLGELAGLSSSFYRDWVDLNKQFKDGRLTAEQLTQEQEKLLAKQPGIKAAREADLKVMQAQYAVQQQITEEIAQAEVARTQAVYAGRQAVTDYARGVGEATRLLEVERQTVTGTASQRSLAVEYLRIELELERQLEAIRTNAGFTQADRDEQAERARATAAQARANATARAEIDHVRELRSELQRVTEQYEQGLTNAAMQGGKSLKEYVVGMLRTTAFRIVLSPMMSGMASILAAVTGAASGSSKGGSGGLMGGIQTASNLNTLWGAGSQALFGGTAGASAASLGYANLVGMAGGDALGALATANGMWAGVATGAQAAAQSAIAANLAIEAGAAAALPAGTTAAAAAGGTAAGGGVMSGISSAASAIPVWGWALAAVAVLGSMLSKKQTLHSGAGAIYSADKGVQEGAGIYNLDTLGMGDVREYNKEGQALASGIATGIGSTLDGLAKSFGQKAGFEVATAFADDTSKDGAWGSLRISKGGKDLLNWDDTRTSRWAPREFADGEAGQKEYLALIAKDTRQVILDMDLPGWADKMLVNIGDAVDMDKLSAVVGQIGQAQTAFQAFGQYMPTFAGLADSAKTALVEASGGISTLTSNMSTFVDLFYSDAEKLAVNTQNVSDALAALGFAMPKTEEEFRALVEAQIALGDEGAKTAASLLGLSGSVAAVLPSAKEAEEAAASRLAESRDKALSALERSIAAEKKAMQSRLDAAKDTASALQGVFDVLHSNVRELYGQAQATRTMLAREGNDFIMAALQKALDTGALPDADELAEAIAAARTGLDASNFGGDAAERDYAANVLAGRLQGLERIAGKQLTDAQKTVRELELQTMQLDQTLEYWRQQLDIAEGTYEAITSVATAIENLRNDLVQTGTAEPGGVNPGGGARGGGGGGGGSTPAAGRGVVPRANYGADEALGSFEKFKAWYTGIRANADPSVFNGTTGYKVPDWMRIHNGADDGSDEEMFGSYLFFRNNPQYAKDLEQVYSTGRSSYATDGSTLVRTDLSKMPAEVAEYYKTNRDALLMTEGFGLDPVLAYQLYHYGPEQFGLDRRTQSFTEWLRNTKWTPDGLVSNNNVVSLAQLNYPDYKLPRWDTSTGNIVDLDGRMYTPDGKFVGNASRAQLDAIYGADYTPTSGGRSALYNAQVGGGVSEADYYGAIRTNLDKAIADGWTAQQLLDAVISTGASLQDVAHAYGTSVAQIQENLRAGGATNIPAYAVGTNYVTRDHVALVHEGEAIIPKAYNPAANPGLFQGSGLDRLIALQESFLSELAQIKSAVWTMATNSGFIADLLSSVKNGNAFIVQLAPE